MIFVSLNSSSAIHCKSSLFRILVDELEEDEVSSPELQHFSLDNALEEKLKKHGLNRRNAKTIICVSFQV